MVIASLQTLPNFKGTIIVMPKTPYDLAAVSDLKDGEMKELEADGKKILLARVDGRFHATSAQCPHYGASLAEGVLCGDRVVCPWHKSVFRVTDGELLEPPALDSLTRYDVFVNEGRVFLRWPDTESVLRTTPAAKDNDSRCFVLAGAGAASVAAAENLRGLGFGGRLMVLTGEEELPYDRTKLSKEFLSGNAGIEELPLRPPDFWEQHHIERVTKRVSEVKTAEHQVVLSDGSLLGYDRLLVATGSTPRSFEVPGADLGNIFTLRSQADAQKIWEAAQPGVRTVVVGGSFIALEVASCFGIRKLSVTVVVPEKAPFAKQLGPEVGRIIQKWHEDHGVVFQLESEVERFEGTGVVRHVALKSGQEIAADLVVLGTGVQPATGFAGSLRQREDGGILADGYLRAADDVYVAGDLTVFPETYSGLPARIEHWRVAEQHGRTAAGNMLGQEKPFDGVPFFWTNHFGTRFDYIGHAEEWDDLILQQGEESPTFIAFYVICGRVMAASACHRDREIAALHELMRLRRVPSPDEIRKGVDLIALAQNAGKLN